MALETLKQDEKIGGFGTLMNDEHGKQMFPVTPGDTFIVIDHGRNTITFKIQNGPIKENGINGCQVDTIIAAAAKIIEGLDKRFPCEENKKALAGLGMALAALEDRRLNREKRGVEGFATA
jgi:hypothetical protein